MSGTVGAGLAAADADLRAALGSSCSLSSGGELLADLASVETLRSLLDAAEAHLLAGVEAARREGAFGSTRQTLDLLADSVPSITRTEAARRVRRADWLAPRLSLTGEVLPPHAPATAAACRDGLVSGAQADVVTDTLEHVPSYLDAAQVAVVEQTLVSACPALHPTALRAFADALLLRLEEEGPEPAEPAEPKPVARGIRESRRRDGGIRFTVDTDDACAVTLRATLDPLAKPCPAQESDGVTSPDPRSAAERRHDALLEICHRLLRSGTLPAAGGAPVTIIATTTLTELQEGRGVAFFDRGDAISIRKLLAMSGDATVVPALFSDHGAALCLGREQRLASTAQRRVLAARDGGCTFPGCDRPAAWSEVHHVLDWLLGGPTDIDNLTLLCRHHHRTFDANGWQVRMTDGLPEWTPPPWIDPQQRPRTNRVRRRPDIAFAPASEATPGAVRPPEASPPEQPDASPESGPPEPPPPGPDAARTEGGGSRMPA